MVQLINAYYKLTDAESILVHLRDASAKVLSRNEVKSQALHEEVKYTSHMEVSIDPEHYRTLNELLCGPAATYGTQYCRYCFSLQYTITTITAITTTSVPTTIVHVLLQ